MSQPLAHPSRNPSQTALLTLGALGVVYGDIGTSPLYALREVFHGPHAIELNHGNIYGVLSLIVWSLIFVISIKYLLFIMRADNKGEGGILALMALASPARNRSTPGWGGAVVLLGLFGTALLYGDGMITPAISVLSAVEGLKIATPFFEPYIGFIAVLILSCLFFVQKSGTGKIGRFFGPVILCWFFTLGVLGVYGMTQHPEILQALDPRHGFRFLLENGWHGFVALGSVVLVVTGGEALYADMGHFGKKPIQLGWFFVALPGLMLQYFGQGALLLSNPAAAENPFYRLAPEWALLPLVGLSTLATVIASQALLTGAFSLSQQAVQLGYLPRIKILHTSAKEMGQIYVPFINWILYIGTLCLVFEFQTSSRLAAAYGIAVTMTMVITTMLTYIVMTKVWNWNKLFVLPLIAAFITVDLAFFGANIIKVLDGGWVPLVLGAVIFMLMITWKQGRTILSQRISSSSVPLETFIEHSVPKIAARIPGTAIFMTANLNTTPLALIHNVRHNQVVHAQVVLLTVLTVQRPHVNENERLTVESEGEGFFKVIARYGFMEAPDVPELLQRCTEVSTLTISPETTTYFLGRETLISTNRPGMAIWREKIFAFMARNALRAPDYFRIPSERALEIGTVVEI